MEIRRETEATLVFLLLKSPPCCLMMRFAEAFLRALLCVIVVGRDAGVRRTESESLPKTRTRTCVQRCTCTHMVVCPAALGIEVAAQHIAQQEQLGNWDKMHAAHTH